MATVNSANATLQASNKSLFEAVVLADASGELYSAHPTGGDANVVIAAMISTLNSTTANLAAGATYTGTWEETWKYGSITVGGYTSCNGTLYADISTDGVNVDRSLQLSLGNNSTIGIHSLIPTTKYFRARLVNGNTAQTYLRLQTILNPGARVSMTTSRLEQNLDAHTDVLNVRSILTGANGNHNAEVTNHGALNVAPPAAGKTAFGDTLVAQLTPVTALIFSYHIDSTRSVTRVAGSAAIGIANNMARLHTGATANSTATLLSKRSARYSPGIGIRARMSGMFSTPAANTTMTLGIGDSGDGLFFGYNGTSFGALHRHGGSAEVRTLTVTTKSSHAENINITLDGVVTVVAVTNGADATVTASEIALGNFASNDGGWTAVAVGNTVVFTSWESTAGHVGTYSLSGATSAVGSFTRNVVGIAPVDDWYPQTEWNGRDKFDGTGPTGVTLNPQLGNVYQMTYQYLGFGQLAFYIEDPGDGEFHLVHAIAFSGASTTPAFGNPSLPLSINVSNLTGAANVSVSSASMGLFADGVDAFLGLRRGSKASITLGATAAETPMMTLRIGEVFNGKLNKGKCKFLKVSAAVEHTKPVTLNFYSNPTLVGASFANVETNVSIMQIDTSATSFSGGTLLYSLPLGKDGQNMVDLDSDDFAGFLVTGDAITVTIAPKSGNAAEATVAVNYVELL